jgi:hypothetical protein
MNIIGTEEKFYVDSDGKYVGSFSGAVKTTAMKVSNMVEKTTIIDGVETVELVEEISYEPFNIEYSPEIPKHYIEVPSTPTSVNMRWDNLNKEWSEML